MLTLSNDEIAQLIQGKDLVRFPPVRTPEAALESFYAGLVKEITHFSGCAEKTEWGHYGSGYASFVDAWFYFPDGRARGTSTTSEHHYGIYVLLSRLSCFFVVGQGEKTWQRDTSSSYLPDLSSIDSVTHPALLPLELQIDSFLGGAGLTRLRRADLELAIGPEHVVPTIMSEPPFMQFDALFFGVD
jgi:hypothetical protein